MNKEELNKLMQKWMNQHPLKDEYQFELQATFVMCGLYFNNEILAVYEVETYYMTVCEIVNFLLAKTKIYAPHKYDEEYNEV